MPENHTDMSRGEWHSAVPGAVREDIQTGCLQRIATATEKMARSYGNLIEERDRYKWLFENERKFANLLQRRVSALRGTITRMKNAQARAPRARRQK